MARFTIYAQVRPQVGEDLWRWVLEARLVHPSPPIRLHMPRLWSTRYANCDGRMIPIHSESRMGSR